VSNGLGVVDSGEDRPEEDRNRYREHGHGEVAVPRELARQPEPERQHRDD